MLIENGMIANGFSSNNSISLNSDKVNSTVKSGASKVVDVWSNRIKQEKRLKGISDIIQELNGHAQTSDENTESRSSCSGYPLKKSYDNTLSEGMVNSLAMTMKSVGAIVYKTQLGTALRVGSRYVMTAKHVMQEIVGKSANVLASVCVNFNESLVEQGVRTYRVTSLVLWDTELDFAILEIEMYDQSGVSLPPALQLCHDEHEYKNLTEVYLIGYGHPNKSSKVLDIQCEIVWPDSEHVRIARKWLRKKASKLRSVLKLSGKHPHIVDLVDKGYEGLDHPDKFIFHCYMQQGGSGSPVLAKYGPDSVRVVGILTHAVPEFYFYLNNPTRMQIEDKYLFEMGPKMSSIYKCVRNRNPVLASEIFSV